MVKDSNLQMILDRVQTWAKRSGLESSEFVEDLKDSLERGKYVHLKPLLPFHTSFPKPSTDIGLPLLKASRYIAILRNALIFAPVALTWKAVSVATEGFARYTQDNATLPVNFLTFWQNGFGYINDFWKIGHVAELDFQLILLVIFMTIVSVLLGQFGFEARNRELMNLERERSEICYLVSTFVGARTATSNREIEERLGESLANLEEASNALADTFDSFGEIQSQLQNSICVLASEVSKFNSSLVSIDLSANRLSDEVKGLQNKLDSRAEVISISNLLGSLKTQLEKRFPSS